MTMKRIGHPNAVILLAEDDPDDQMFVRQAFMKMRASSRLLMVSDGEELLDYLNRRGAFTDQERYPWPDLILLDLNMPRMDGRKALRQIRSDKTLRKIPVVALT